MRNVAVALVGPVHDRKLQRPSDRSLATFAVMDAVEWVEILRKSAQQR
jgi:hypothetical protein